MMMDDRYDNNPGGRASFADPAGASEETARGQRRAGKGLHPVALVVDDDPYLSKVLCFILEQNQFKCVTAASGDTALETLAKRRPDVVFLDLLLPDMDGFEVIGRIRQISAVPILVITALPETRNKVRALSLGADDYLSKPFDYDELVAKARALMRRLALNVAGRGEGVLQVGDLRVDLERRKVWREGVDLDLGTIHWRLLYHLLVRRGRVVTYDELQDSVWPGAHHGLGYLRQWVSRLRRRIGDVDAHIIRNVPGQGYSIESNGQ